MGFLRCLIATYMYIYMVGESVSLLVWGERKMDGGNCRNLKEGERVGRKESNRERREGAGRRERAHLGAEDGY